MALILDLIVKVISVRKARENSYGSGRNDKFWHNRLTSFDIYRLCFFGK